MTNKLFRPKKWTEVKAPNRIHYVRFVKHTSVPNPKYSKECYEVLTVRKEPNKYVLEVGSATPTMDREGTKYISHIGGDREIKAIKDIVHPGTTYGKLFFETLKSTKAAIEILKKENLWKLYHMN